MDNASTYTRESNATVSFAASCTVEPALLLITPRANMHAFDNDHDYCEDSPVDHFLNVYTVRKVSCEQATQIEEETRDQAVTAMWQNVQSALQSQDLADKTYATKLTRSLQQINNISAAPLEHDRKYENTAITLVLAYWRLKQLGMYVSTSSLVCQMSSSFHEQYMKFIHAGVSFGTRHAPMVRSPVE